MSTSYPNLPGIEIEVKDGGLILPQDNSTESMLIIAPTTATNAPVDPTLVRESGDLTANGYGSYVTPAGVVNELAAAWKAANEGGCRNVSLLPLAGTTDKDKFMDLYSKLFGVLADYSTDNLVVKGVYADVEINPIASADYASAEDKANFPNLPGVITNGPRVDGGTAITLPLTVVASPGAGANDTFVLTVGTADVTIQVPAGTYNTVEAIAAQINDLFVGNALTVKFEASNNAGKMVIKGDRTFSVKAGGNGLTALGLSAGASTTSYRASFAKLVADYCENQTFSHNVVIGYIGTTPAVSGGLADVKTSVDGLVALRNEYSAHLQVVGCPELGYTLPGLVDLYYTSGVVSYAALITTLRAESAPTNKVLRGVAGIRYNLSLRQLNALSGSKYVSFRLKNGQISVTDGITTAPQVTVGNTILPSDYTRLSTLRITLAAIKLVREIADPFVGEPNGTPQRNALTAAVKSGLEAMKSKGAIVDYRFSVVATLQDSILGQAKVTLELVPAFELKKISTTVSLRPQM